MIYIFLYSLIIFKIKFVKNTDLPDSDGHYDTSNWMLRIYNFFHHLLLNKGLFNVYTKRDIKHISDIPQGIIVNKCIIISILLSLIVQLLFIDKVSL